MDDNLFKDLRKRVRQNGKEIIEHIVRNHFDPENIANEAEICCFCGSNNRVTKEHVLPKWTFENDPNEFFLTLINDSKQKFIQTAIPACNDCNNNLLSKIENHIKNLFLYVDLKNDYFEYEELVSIIRWLEIIEYKFHVLEFRRKFKIHKRHGYIPIFRDVPMSIMRIRIQLSPYKALSQLRKSQARLKRKEKDTRFFSLVFYRMKNRKDQQKLFFHSMDNYIFFQFPEYGLSLFYFYNKTFNSNYDAEKEALKIIQENYGDPSSSMSK